MTTVCSRPSTTLTCRMRAAKARASASRFASTKGLSNSMLLPPHDLGAREALEILLHPVGRVGGQTVLPACEPQQHETHVVNPCIPDYAVQNGEIELTFLLLDLSPRNGRQNAVEPRADEFGPYRLHVLEAGGGFIPQFARHRQERLAVHD